MTSNEEALRALDKLKGLCALKEFRVDDIYDCYDTIRAALERESVDVEKIAKELVKQFDNDDVKIGIKELAYDLIKTHKGKMIL